MLSEPLGTGKVGRFRLEWLRRRDRSSPFDVARTRPTPHMLRRFVRVSSDRAPDQGEYDSGATTLALWIISDSDPRGATNLFRVPETLKPEAATADSLDTTP